VRFGISGYVPTLGSPISPPPKPAPTRNYFRIKKSGYMSDAVNRYRERGKSKMEMFQT
jgi:hypothetical protein